MTRTFVEKIGPAGPAILDTRKCPAGWRIFDKYAVRCGGGRNHRFGLDDGILIKDTHLAACPSIREAVARAKRNAGHLSKVEVEVQGLSQVEEAIEAGADIILLDNMSIDDLQKAVVIIKGRALVEISGGVSIDRIAELADLGADFISVGGLTHSAPAADLHLELQRCR